MTLKDYVKISYELTQDGLVIGKGKLPEVICGTTRGRKNKPAGQRSGEWEMLFKTHLPPEKRNATAGRGPYPWI